MSAGIVDWFKWKLWKLNPAWLPNEYRLKILAQSPYVCDQIGQGSPMIVMRREVWNAGGYEQVPGAPINRQGEVWILREWFREHPDWRP